MTNKINDLLAYPGLKIVQNEDAFCFSIDSLLLANFIDTEKCEKIVDLGTGNAPIPLYLSLKTNAKIYGIEIQEKVYNLAEQSVLLNNLETQIKIINSNLIDVYQIIGANNFDVVVCNPPYFKYDINANVNDSEYTKIARHEVCATLNDIIKEANKLLKNGKDFYMIHRVERLAEIMLKLEDNNFGIKIIQFIHPKKGYDAKLFLIKAKKNKPTAIKVLNPIYIHEDKEYSETVRKIFYFKK